MSRCDANERGSVLMLMPAAILVVLILGALAVDGAIVFLAERTVADAAAAAANDAATAALDESAFYDCGQLEIDQARAAEVAVASYSARGADFLEPAGGPSVDIASSAEAEVQVTVTAAASVDLIFASALPAVPASRTVEASATATARKDPDLPAPTAGC